MLYNLNNIKNRKNKYYTILFFFRKNCLNSNINKPKLIYVKRKHD